ncbi:MAG: hypothetical protein WC503_02810 [Candidatus Shapirobacteria bacterium]
MRCDQFYGLNDWARSFLSSITKKCVEHVYRYYEDGTEEILPTRELEICQIKSEYSGKNVFGMYDNEYPLFKYTFPDGRVYKEYEQIIIHSSGPMIFTALKNEDGFILPESLWDEEEIQGY